MAIELLMLPNANDDNPRATSLRQFAMLAVPA
jgi:hypothetical protein